MKLKHSPKIIKFMKNFSGSMEDFIKEYSLLTTTKGSPHRKKHAAKNIYLKEYLCNKKQDLED